MTGDLVVLTKYGRQVFANAKTEEMRRTECLCLNCKALHDCAIAKEGLRLCQLTDIAFMVTRCPKFVKN